MVATPNMRIIDFGIFRFLPFAALPEGTEPVVAVFPQRLSSIDTSLSL
jgi:hypothetical protein